MFLTQLQAAIEGAFEKRRFLARLRSFIVFEDDGGGGLAKKMAGYHQLHAVETAVAETLCAAEQRMREEPGRYESGRKPGGKPGDRRIGVVWHPQGSGKSLTMAFYAGRIILEPAMANPTIVVLTDRNDLDDQLFATFSRCRDLLRPAARSGREPGRPPLPTGSRIGGRGVHHYPEVLPRGEGRPAPSPLGAPQRGRHRRRGAPPASTTSSTVSPATCEMRCPTPPSPASPEPRSSFRTPTPERCSVTTSASTTSSVRSRTRRRCRSTTRVVSPSSPSTRTNGPISTLASRKRPRAKSSTARRSSRPGGRSSKPSWVRNGASRSSLRTWLAISRSASRPWTARRWSSA